MNECLELKHLLSVFRYLSGSEGPCDQAHLPGSGPGRPPHRVERLAQTCGAAASRSLQLLLPSERGREGGALCCRYSFCHLQPRIRFVSSFSVYLAVCVGMSFTLGMLGTHHFLIWLILSLLLFSVKCAQKNNN